MMKNPKNQQNPQSLFFVCVEQISIYTYDIRAGFCRFLGRPSLIPFDLPFFIINLHGIYVDERTSQ